MRGDLVIISTYLKPWERPGVLRYYCTGCAPLTDEERTIYMKRTGKDPRDRKTGIKLYFDDKGVLHVDNCCDAAFEETLELRVSQWYERKSQQFRSRFKKHIHIYDHLEHFSERLPDGRYVIRYKGLTYTCERCDMDYLRRFGEVIYDDLTGAYEISPEEPELRAILAKMIEDLDPKRTGILPVPGD